LKELDILLTQLAASVNVDIMAGECDPSNFTLPQQPFNKCLLPRSYQYSTFRSVTNPYEFEIDGRLFLGTSGQTISNLEKYLVVPDSFDLLEHTLNWRHIAPSAPDQLPCYPFTKADPFILEKCPHVYFIGNQKKFCTKKLTGKEGQEVRLISLPRFAENPMVVLVNLDTLNIHPISFNVNL